mmetsp:Transcript_108595/g.324750  ORF Transcript_108595/g.324750 Transcript_108595/m.324750 type:complete len:192 (+) Transcript_108595:81-656(+)
MAAAGARTTSGTDAQELAPDAASAQRGRGAGRKARKGRRGTGGRGGAFTAAPSRPGHAAGEAGSAGDGGGARPHTLSANVQGMRFMQSAKDEEQRRRREREQLRHLGDLRWVVPGFEAEVLEAERSQEKPEQKKAGPPQVLLHRRSFKGFNPVVERWMQEQLRKQAAAKKAAEELEEAEALQSMKRSRKGL